MTKRRILFGLILIFSLTFILTSCKDTLKGTEAIFVGFTNVSGDTYSISVSNVTEVFNFDAVVKINDDSSWKLATDVEGKNIIDSKIAFLKIGDNTFYVLVTTKKENIKYYTLNLRRRPIYNVYFDVGVYIPNQTIEEGGFAEEPQKPERTGYTFYRMEF